MLQTSSLFPGLKADGWHITVNTTPTGHEVCKHDPNVDAWIIQDKDQVPNGTLDGYWKGLGQEYDRVINLCESVECTLLAVPGRRNFSMSHAARHRMMNINYLEWLHLLADVPFASTNQAVFYPTSSEISAMRRIIRPAPNGPASRAARERSVVVWALAGSSVHKVWPWVDHSIQSLLENGVRVSTIGGEECQMLEAAIMQTLMLNNFGVSYETSNEMTEGAMLAKINERFGKQALSVTSGKLGIRESLTLAGLADVVVGPETGALNAVGGNPDVHKVIMLSHSSVENLTKHWVNKTVLESTGCPDSPCHRMHYDRTYCPEDAETGASLCASAIPASVVVSAIMQALAPKLREVG